MSVSDLLALRMAEELVEGVLAHHWAKGRFSMVEEADLDDMVQSAFSNIRSFGG